jgi:hypothetical protein
MAMQAVAVMILVAAMTIDTRNPATATRIETEEVAATMIAVSAIGMTDETVDARGLQ